MSVSLVVGDDAEFLNLEWYKSEILEPFYVKTTSPYLFCFDQLYHYHYIMYFLGMSHYTEAIPHGDKSIQMLFILF